MCVVCVVWFSVHTFQQTIPVQYIVFTICYVENERIEKIITSMSNYNCGIVNIEHGCVYTFIPYYDMCMCQCVWVKLK